MINRLNFSVNTEENIDKTLMKDPSGTEISVIWNANMDLFLSELFKTANTLSFVDSTVLVGTEVSLRFKSISRSQSLYQSRDLDIDKIVNEETVNLAQVSEIIDYLVARGAMPLGDYIVTITA